MFAGGGVQEPGLGPVVQLGELLLLLCRGQSAEEEDVCGEPGLPGEEKRGKAVQHLLMFR